MNQYYDDSLIFTARLISDYTEDKERVFALTYSLKDNSIIINESKNKKIEKPSRFLAKSLIRDPKNNLPYTTESFYIGARINASGRIFEIVDAPEYTISFMEAHANMFHVSDIDLIFAEIRKSSSVYQQFKLNDPGSIGNVSNAKAIDVMDKHICKHSIITLIRRFSRNDMFPYQKVLKYAEVK